MHSFPHFHGNTKDRKSRNSGQPRLSHVGAQLAMRNEMQRLTLTPMRNVIGGGIGFCAARSTSHESISPVHFMQKEGKSFSSRRRFIRILFFFFFEVAPSRDRRNLRVLQNPDVVDEFANLTIAIINNDGYLPLLSRLTMPVTHPRSPPRDPFISSPIPPRLRRSDPSLQSLPPTPVGP